MVRLYVIFRPITFYAYFFIETVHSKKESNQLRDHLWISVDLFASALSTHLHFRRVNDAENTHKDIQ